MPDRQPARSMWRRAIVAALMAVSALLGWALLWPDSTCAQPACARQRFKIAVEVDALNKVPPVPFAVPGKDRSVSLQAILRAGGIDTTVTPDNLDLPYKAASGPLDRADLYRFTAAWGSKDTPKGADAKIYALLAAALVSDTGEPLFGMMFDVRDRQGIAVAPATTAHHFGKREPDAVPLLQLRTFTHELLHALNRRHYDAVQMPDGRLTLEAPTRCISEQEEGQWFLREPPLMQISPVTIRFFQTAATRDILPGEASSPFSSRRASPTECDDVRARTADAPAQTRWELAVRRLRDLFSVSSATAAEVAEVEPATSGQEQVELRIQAMPAPYPLGYPIAVRVLARNVGEQEVPIKGRLDPSYGTIRIEHRRASDDDGEWSVVEPLAWFEPVGDEYAMLQPGESTEQTVAIYFGSEGWTFPEPGDYEVRARLQSPESEAAAVSEVIRIAIVDAHTPEDEAALRPLLTDERRLDVSVGRLLSFGGRIVSGDGLAEIETAVDRYGDTALGSALRLTLVSQRLRPPIDPLTGERPQPDLSEARELLRDTCTDSGIAALKAQLLERHSGGIPRNLSHRAETEGTAWDGTSSRGDSQPTYSDRALEQWGPSLHFCLNETEMRDSVQAVIPRLARQLRRTEPARVVIVGHGDYEGSCRLNDVIGLRRAEAVRRALRAGGLRTRSIEIASLGERRPLDFASTSAAHDLNRRVEILIESTQPEAERPELPDRVAPRCPPEKRRPGQD